MRKKELTVLLLCSAATAKPKAIKSKIKTIILSTLEAIAEEKETDSQAEKNTRNKTRSNFY